MPENEASKVLVVESSYTKSTKGTHVYAEDEEQSGIRSLYISRDTIKSLWGSRPERIRITVEVLA